MVFVEGISDLLAFVHGHEAGSSGGAGGSGGAASASHRTDTGLAGRDPSGSAADGEDARGPDLHRSGNKNRDYKQRHRARRILDTGCDYAAVGSVAARRAS